MARRAARSSRDPIPAPSARPSNGPGWFTGAATKISQLAGRPLTFLIAAGLIILWGATGPLFGFSDTWQLMVNTTTTIVTFLMVFLIQNTQNRDTAALQVKLDALIFATRGAQNKLAAAEDMSDEELEQLHSELQQIESVDESEQQLLQTLMSDIRKLTEAGEGDHTVPDRLGEGLKEGIELFEASHPQATMLMGQVIDALAKMGI